MIQQPGQIHNQQSLNCQPGMILPPAPFMQSQQQFIQPQQQFIQPQQQFMQQLSCGQMIERPLSIGGGGGMQTLVSVQQPFLSPSNSTGLMSTCMSGTQFIS